MTSPEVFIGKVIPAVVASSIAASVSAAASDACLSVMAVAASVLIYYAASSSYGRVMITVIPEFAY